MLELKLFARDFVGEVLPTEVGEIAVCKQLGEVRVIELWGNCVLAEVI